ncbi:MAG: phosphatidate cytidylyltransferase [Chloroflexota bacterium]|nr:phosphatidate cytidylyltransferase [Chloroflexota bacterium]
MLKKRLLSALWGIPLLVTVIWFGEPWFTIVFCGWGLLAAFEFYRLVAAVKVPPLTTFGLTWTALLIIGPHFGYLAPYLFTSAVILPLIWLVFRPQKEQAFARWAWTVAGLLYIGWLLSYMVSLRGLEAGRSWAFLGLFTTFAADTAAYFVGRAWGKHRLAPLVSPNKTWEGAVAGVLGSIIAALILVRLVNLPLSYGQAVFLGLLASIFGQFGDLAKSLFKRNMGVKDSGKLVPGHGGALDRLDSVLFAGVVVYYYALAFNSGWLDWLA